MHRIDVVLVTIAMAMALQLAGPRSAAGQPVPRPFPRPGGQPTDPTLPAPEAPPVAIPVAPLMTQAASEVPTDESLGVPIYPTADYLASYSAGQGQRYYLFGSNLSFREMTAYYQNVLDERGDMLFSTPPTYVFDVGRFDDDRMAFRPGVTIKDFTWNGSPGYANSVSGAEPAHYATIIQIVPVPQGTARR